MSGVIRYSVDYSGVAEIASHLKHVDVTFSPALSSRVDIHVYAQKLYDRARRFEAWKGGDLVGLVATYCGQVGESAAFVSSVSVWPELRGQGIAKKLMQQCLDYVRIRGLERIDLKVDGRAGPAYALYKKLGFSTLTTNQFTHTMSITLGEKTI